MRLPLVAFALALVAGCGGPSPATDAGVPGVDAPPRADAGDLTSGPLTVEILAPTRGTSYTGTRDPESPRICEFRASVRVRVRGEGASDVDYVDVATDHILGFYPVAMIDGPDGRVGEADISLGRALDTDVPLDVTVAARVTAVPTTEVRTVVRAESCP